MFNWLLSQHTSVSSLLEGRSNEFLLLFLKVQTKKAVIKKIVDAVGFIEHSEIKQVDLSGTTDHTEEKVKQFYVRDDISRQAPGRKDSVTIREDGVKKTCQKRHLSMSVLEAYRVFQDEYPEIKIGKSKFAALRPREVFTKAETPHNVCLCKYHENTQMLLESVHKHIPRHAFQSVSAFIRALVCSPDSPECMLNGCKTCCNAILLQNIISNIPDEDKNIQTMWHSWESEGGFQVKIMKRGELRDVFALLLASATKFLKHCFIKRNQSAVFQQKMKDTSETSAVLQIDFAENYTTAYQDEIQAAHWTSRQVTLFTAVAWGKADVQSYAIVSDSLEHEKKAAVTFLSKVVEDLKKKNPRMEKLHIFSDGAASHFKNKFIWSFMSTIFGEIFPSLKVEWHFFATSHGKGAVDGVGGTVKRSVSSAVLSRKVIVNNAQSFAKTAAHYCPNINIKLVMERDIQTFTHEHQLERLWTDVKPLIGTQSVHHIEPISWGLIKHSQYSSSLEAATHKFHHSNEDEPQAHPTEPLVNIKTGDCLQICYKGKKSSREFVGLVTDLDSDGLEIQFLRRNDEMGFVYILPTKEDKSWVEKGQIIQRLSPFLDNRGRYHFKEAVLAE
ncbi:uncharacterized protein [Chanodichthys erythropterus]|uniref:uncharacterized protein n=1 Tax=Chanodichthys erythropterus TaxID=933992 RepID=UPI00351F5E62